MSSTSPLLSKTCPACSTFSQNQPKLLEREKRSRKMMARMASPEVLRCLPGSACPIDQTTLDGRGSVLRQSSCFRSLKLSLISSSQRQLGFLLRPSMAGTVDNRDGVVLAVKRRRGRPVCVCSLCLFGPGECLVEGVPHTELGRNQ